MTIGDSMTSVLALRSETTPDYFHLPIGIFVVGRSSKVDIIVEDDTVSRRHAELCVTAGQITVRDLGSRNGTYIDKRRVTEAPLAIGQRLEFGSVAFFLMAPAPHAENFNSEVETARPSAKPTAERKCGHLSRAQGRVLDLLLEGLSEKQVAARLKLSTTTVHNHVQSIYKSLDVHSRSELLVLLLGGR